MILEEVVGLVQFVDVRQLPSAQEYHTPLGRWGLSLPNLGSQRRHMWLHVCQPTGSRLHDHLLRRSPVCRGIRGLHGSAVVAVGAACAVLLPFDGALCHLMPYDAVLYHELWRSMASSCVSCFVISTA